MCNITHTKSLAAYSFSHFCIDFCCFFVLVNAFKNSTADLTLVTIAALIYNAIAFGTQPLTGYLNDIAPKFPFGLMGCGLVAAGVLTLQLHWFSLIICALGNAFFHTAGGTDSLRYSGGRMARSGIFVSTGALGVAFGTLYARGENASVFLPLALIAASALCIALFALKQREGQAAQAPMDVSSGLPFAAVIVLALAAIAIRSFDGFFLPVEWKKASVFLALLPAIAAFFGKAAGGFMGDLFGARRAGVISLFLSAPLLLLGNTAPALSATGIVLFNMAMPITLCTVYSRLPQNPGLAFGLTTLALLCGNAPVFFIRLAPDIAPFIIAGLIVLAALSVFLSAGNSTAAVARKVLPVGKGKKAPLESNKGL